MGRLRVELMGVVRHGPSAVLAILLVLVGSGLQIRVRRRVADEDGQRLVSATVINVVAPGAVIFIAGAVTYLRMVGLTHGGNAKATTVLVAAALLACAAYMLLVAMVALAVAVVSHGVRRAWASLWTVAAMSVTAAVPLPIGWGRCPVAPASRVGSVGRVDTRAARRRDVRGQRSLVAGRRL